MNALAEFETYGIISLVPVLVVIITAVVTKRAAETLILGTFLGGGIF